MSEEWSNQVIKAAEQHLLHLEDGFLYFDAGGAWSAAALRIVADELDRRNEPHQKEIEEYFNRVKHGDTTP